MPETPEQPIYQKINCHPMAAGWMINCTLEFRGGLPSTLALTGRDHLPTLLEHLNIALAA